MNTHATLEFDKILEMLAENALSDTVKTRCRCLAPSLNEAEVKRRMEETTQAKYIIEQTGTPPLVSMTELQKVIDLVAIGAMLTPDQIVQVSFFLVACRRMKAYLKRAQAANSDIAWYGGSINELPELEEEIERCIRNGTVDDRASSQLEGIRRKIAETDDQIKAKLESLLQKNKAWFSESFVSTRNGRHTLPVKREYKNNIPGTVVEMSNTGGTCFIEPTSVGKLQSQISILQIEEDNEVRRILYSLTALIGDNLPAIKLNMEAMETLDFLFAKGKLSLAMNGSPVGINTKKELRIVNAVHPLLNPDTAVPLDFEAGGNTLGVVITGPNTGGKTVALKTVGLLSLMAQSGLHVPAHKSSSFCMHNLVLCDVGDGQSITENLSTFSAHIKNIIEILEQADDQSLVLIDELGSGTDPAEGMGLAVAVLDELCAKKCLFLVTTHYPEIKEYAAGKAELINARMAFDKESLMPLYRLEMGEAGESCALYIAEKLGMPGKILKRAYEAAYSSANKKVSAIERKVTASPGSPVPKEAAPNQTTPGNAATNAGATDNAAHHNTAKTPRISVQKEQRPKTETHRDKFNIGDSVIVYPKKETGIVYSRANEKGEVGVQVKGKKKLVNHKRLKLQVPASALYPENYDFSIIFDSVADRKARHLMGKRHQEGNIIYKEKDDRQSPPQ